jgi:hypothetical protein
MTSRRELLRQYLLELLRSGQFLDARTKAQVIQAFGAAMLEDASAVLTEMMATATQNIAGVAAERASGIGKFALGKLSEWLDVAKQKGFKSAWANLQEIYWRGVDANARRE